MTMARVKLVFKPTDFPGTPDDGTKKALSELFGHMFPGQSNPEIPGKSSAFATVTQDPKLALLLVKLSDYIVREMPWTSTRLDLRQLTIQTLNYHFKCHFSFQSHLHPAAAAGIRLEQQATIPFWETVNTFSDEQRLVIEYTLAVVKGKVSDELFTRVLDQYGEKETIAFTTGIAWWSFWAMIINATRTDFDFGYGRASA
jgi:alkylhydroperoxidase family enzyme